MSILYDNIKDDLVKITTKLDSIRANKTKLTFSDLLSIFHEVIIDFVHASVLFRDAGPDHKQAVLEAAGTFFDNVLINIKVVQTPDMLKPIVDKFAREIFLELVGAGYDESLRLLSNEVLKPAIASPPA